MSGERLQQPGRGGRRPGRLDAPSEEVHCGYVASWIAVKHTWDLTVDQDEEALREMLEDR